MESLIQGQLLIDIDGHTLSADDIEVIKHPRVSGVVLFTKNFYNSEQLTNLCASIKAIKPKILILADQEGGRVQRFVGSNFTKLEPISNLGKLANKNLELALIKAKKQGFTMATELIAHGVDISLAPVLDIDPGNSQVLKDRCFSNDPYLITKLAASYIKGMADAGMLTIAKHFPGHGGVSNDTHYLQAKDFRQLNTILQYDLIPFISLSSATQGIMLSHIIFPEVDNLPCSLSKVWVQYIKNHLKLDQLLITDCLSMQAIAKQFPKPEDRVKMAFNAGLDLVIYCNDRAGLLKVLNKIPTTTSHKLLTKLNKWELIH